MGERKPSYLPSLHATSTPTIVLKRVGTAWTIAVSVRGMMAEAVDDKDDSVVKAR